MLDPQNLVNIMGGLVADPEFVNDGRILKLSIGVDYSASDKNSDNTSGYFDVVYYLKDKDGFASKNASFVHNQVEQSKMKKGTTVHIVGRLVQERWKQDDKNRSRVIVVAEHMSYGTRSSSGSSKTSDSSDSSSPQSQSVSVPSSF